MVDSSNKGPERPPSSLALGRLAEEIEAQLAFEQWWVEGIKRVDVENINFLSKRGRATSDKSIRGLLQHLAEGLGLLIEARVEKHTNTGRGKGAGKGQAQRRSDRILSDLVKSIEPYEIAYLVLTNTVNSVLEKDFVYYANMTEHMVQALEQELRLRAMVKIAPNLPGIVNSVVSKGRSSIKHRLRVFTNLYNKHHHAIIPRVFEDADSRLEVGVALVELLLSPQGQTVISVQKEYCPKNQQMRWAVRPNEQLKALATRDMEVALLAKRTMPLGITLYEPNIRTTEDHEMLLTREVAPVKINQLSGKSKSQLAEAMRQGEEGFNVVLQALTKLEQTPVRINEKMLAYVLEHKQELKAVGALTDATLRLPSCPFPKTKQEYTEREAERLKEWKRTTEAAHNAFWKARIGIIQQNRVLEFAEKLATYPRFYFRHYSDFRGRLYPVNSLLSFQGGGLCKSLLEFAEPVSLIVGDPQNTPWCELVEYGLRLLPQFAKAPISGIEPYFDNRKGLGDITEGLEEDLKVTLLRVGKKNFLPLISWVLEIKHLLLSWGSWAKSGHPIRRDATCSSMQHMAAMSGDQRVLELTNCCPNAKEVKDLYTSVVPDYKSLGLERDSIKQFIMTFAYNSTDFTRADEIGRAFQEKLGVALPRVEVNKIVGKLKQEAYKGLGNVVKLQEFLMEAYRELVQVGDLSAVSRTPIGFIVDSTKYEWPVKTYRLYHLDAKIQVRLQFLDTESEKAKRDKRKTRQAWVANVIHSMDACLLHVTLSALSNFKTRHTGASKKYHLATVHDCVVTRPGDMGPVMKALGFAFKFMYAPDSETGIPRALKVLADYWGLETDYPELYTKLLTDFPGVPATTFDDMKYFFV